jgi:predicted negative regulator of RcsB-dependent stress response
MYPEALVEIEKALELEKEDPLIFEHLGDVHVKLGDKEAAIKAWEKALEYHEKEKGLKERIEKKIKNLENGIQ